MRNKTSGFTLIELLIAVVIIGILAISITISVTGQQTKARDSRRLADWSTMEKIFASYYMDNLIYPPETSPDPTCDSSYGTDSNNVCPPSAPGNSTPGKWDTASTFYTDLVPKYISSLPVDPVNTATFYYSYEPSNITARQCFYWQFWTETNGTTLVRKDIGDLKDGNGVLQATCNF